ALVRRDEEGQGEARVVPRGTTEAGRTSRGCALSDWGFRSDQGESRLVCKGEPKVESCKRRRRRESVPLLCADEA
ncbi:hypothetical protein OAO87_03605, partial [bacterium]|nr:hypothetical protein [bacterium]